MHPIEKKFSASALSYIASLIVIFCVGGFQTANDTYSLFAVLFWDYNSGAFSDAAKAELFCIHGFCYSLLGILYHFCQRSISAWLVHMLHVIVIFTSLFFDWHYRKESKLNIGVLWNTNLISGHQALNDVIRLLFCSFGWFSHFSNHPHYKGRKTKMLRDPCGHLFCWTFCWWKNFTG